MLLEQTSPVAVAELRRALRRADDVGEQHRREDAVGIRSSPNLWVPETRIAAG